MVLFEKKAFDEKRVLSIETGASTGWSSNVKDKYYIRMTLDNGQQIFWERYLPETVTKKVEELVNLINERENEIIKLKKAE